jgi:hypothetical protein
MRLSGCKEYIYSFHAKDCKASGGEQHKVITYSPCFKRQFEFLNTLLVEFLIRMAKFCF